MRNFRTLSKVQNPAAIPVPLPRILENSVKKCNDCFKDITFSNDEIVAIKQIIAKRALSNKKEKSNLKAEKRKRKQSTQKNQEVINKVAKLVTKNVNTSVESEIVSSSTSASPIATTKTVLPSQNTEVKAVREKLKITNDSDGVRKAMSKEELSDNKPSYNKSPLLERLLEKCDDLQQANNNSSLPAFLKSSKPVNKYSQNKNTNKTTFTTASDLIPKDNKPDLNFLSVRNKSHFSFICKKCDTHYLSLKKLICHERKTHTKCFFCKKKFQTVNQCDNHVKKTCTINKSLVKIKPFKIELVRVDKIEEVRRKFASAFKVKDKVDVCNDTPSVDNFQKKKTDILQKQTDRPRDKAKTDFSQKENCDDKDRVVIYSPVLSDVTIELVPVDKIKEVQEKYASAFKAKNKEDVCNDTPCVDVFQKEKTDILRKPTNRFQDKAKTGFSQKKVYDDEDRVVIYNPVLSDVTIELVPVDKTKEVRQKYVSTFKTKDKENVCSDASVDVFQKDKSDILKKSTDRPQDKAKIGFLQKENCDDKDRIVICNPVTSDFTTEGEKVTKKTKIKPCKKVLTTTEQDESDSDVICISDDEPEAQLQNSNRKMIKIVNTEILKNINVNDNDFNIIKQILQFSNFNKS